MQVILGPKGLNCWKLGQIVIYDMAGHYQYYSSHAALLKSMVSSSSSMFLMVVSQNQEKEEITCQLASLKISKIVAQCCATFRRTFRFEHLTTLSNKGQFLFLRNARKVEDSWLVIDKAVLLSEVNGTVLALDNFKQHRGCSILKDQESVAKSRPIHGGGLLATSGVLPGNLRS